jgi:hypothetical protein
MVKRLPSGGTSVAIHRIAAVCAAVALVVLCAARLAHAATARDPKFQTNVERTVRYLQNTQQESGGFAEPGEQPGSDFTAWVALALAAAGINPRDQTTAKQYWVGGHSAYTYLAEHAPEELTERYGNHPVTTNFERELLVVDTSGTSPHDFGGIDLVGEILNRQIATGSNKGAFPHEAGSQEPGVNDTIFAILALSPVHEPLVQEAIGRATQWLEAQQKCDGSWNWEYTPRVSPCNPRERRLLPKEPEGEIDMTGAALQALNATDHLDPEGQKRAVEYLHEAERANGGLPEFTGETEPNVASTAWAVQAMWSAGINPETWLTELGQEPLGYLASMQQEDGHIRYRASDELNGMWMTAYAAPAFFGDPWPIPETLYKELPPLPPGEPTASGNGGVSTNPGSGVIAGGGGNGAPLFSRPQPASKGHTPGGARQLKSGKHDPPRTHELNPGPARRTPVLTITATAASKNRVRRHREPEDTGSTCAGAGASAATTSDIGQAGAASQSESQGQGSGDRSAGSRTDGGSSNSGVSIPTSGVAQSTSGVAETEVKGVLIGAPCIADSSYRVQAGAPGLRSAGAGGDGEQWPTTATCAAIALLILTGVLIEYRRPQMTL